MNAPPGDDDISDLLAWYVNATLDPESRDRVARYLENSPGCRAEELWLRQLRAKLQEATAAHPQDAGLEKLRAMIRAERARKLVSLTPRASAPRLPKR